MTIGAQSAAVQRLQEIKAAGYLDISADILVSILQGLTEHDGPTQFRVVENALPKDVRLVGVVQGDRLLGPGVPGHDVVRIYIDGEGIEPDKPVPVPVLCTVR